MAEIAYQRGELDTALQDVTRGIELCRQLNWKTQPLAAGLVTLAWIRQASGDPGGALEAIAEAERIAPSPSLANLFNPVPAQRARLLLAQGEVAAAARWAQEGGLRADDEPMYQKEREHLVLARVLMAQDQPAEALALLDRLYAAAAAQDRVGSLIEIGALRALALAASGEGAAAVAGLAEALTLACPQGYARVFADEGPPMAALLGKLIAARRSDEAAADVPLGCLARLQRALSAQGIAPETGRVGLAAVPGLVDPLTSRELEVLDMLAAGRSNQAIASQLVVTLDTVKKHVSHVLGKLGAANRTEAVARGRELSLIR
jgi:LuxR family maltose regulon positive regulatory protein